jgi:predicted phage tail protein
MSDPDQGPPSGPTLNDFGRKLRPATNPDDGAPPQRSGFLSRCASVLLIVFGAVLAGPGVCYLALARTKADLFVPLLLMLGLTMVAGGIVWLSEIGRARRARRRRQG